MSNANKLRTKLFYITGFLMNTFSKSIFIVPTPSVFLIFQNVVKLAVSRYVEKLYRFSADVLCKSAVIICKELF